MSEAPRHPETQAAARVFAALAGCFLGLTLVKFGNPPILDRFVARPTGLLELALQPWPAPWAYVGLAIVSATALVCVRPRWPAPRWPWFLILAWFGWQFASAATTIDARLTGIALAHFTGVMASLALGACFLGRLERLEYFWIGLLAGFAFMAWVGIDQHYGGLEATRQQIYARPDWQTLSPEFLKRLNTMRVFATLLYPNALAGVLLLLLPGLITVTWQLTRHRRGIVRLLLTSLVGWAGLACLGWSGSKAGWLIALGMGLAWFLRLDLDRRLRNALLCLLLLAGLAGFAVKFSGYFAKGATSVSARLDYWRAGWRTFREHPMLGTGPGTFAASYRRIKPPESEMALLTHNDYLQQASDSGLVGAVGYAGFVGVSLVLLGRKSWRDPLRFAVWLGLAGWATQSCVEFGLYIPAIGWTAFWLLGWLWGVPDGANRSDNPTRLS